MKKVKVLLYCTKSTHYLVKDDFPLENQPIYYTQYKEDPRCCGLPLNGKIVAMCDIETEEIKIWGDEIRNYFGNNVGIDIEERACLKFEQIEQYLCTNDYKGYTLHISNLKIFKQAKKLNDYSYYKKNKFNKFYEFENIFRSKYELTTLHFAPKNMMKVYDHNGNHLILISIRPEWLCKILNGEKTIEVRKRVLKEML